MTIGKKIVGGYLLVLLLLGVAMWTAFHALQRTQTTYEEFVDVDQRLLEVAVRLEAESTAQVAAYRAALLFPERRAAYLAELQTSRERFEAAMAEMRRIARNAEGRALIEELGSLQQRIVQRQDRIVERVRSSRDLPEVRDDIEQARQLNEALLQRAADFRERQHGFIAQERAALTATVRNAVVIVIAVSLLALALGLIVGASLSRTITRQLQSSISQLSSSAAEILATTSQVASGAAETATAVSQTTATVEEVKQTAQVATQKARYVSESAQKASQVSGTGRRSVEETIAGMQRIQEQMQSIAESIVRLNEQSQAIGDIIATVNDLAEQSNLLAVNAAIEAARAGEQGKGFAVVAQEVRNLAEQSKGATAQVRTILGEIQKATSAAVLATEQGSKAVEQGMQRSSEAGESIRMLADSINDAAEAAIQIAASSQQQMVGMDQVALAMENIKEASMQNVSGTKQAEAAAQSLNQLGHQLGALIGRARA